jgi:hypothetical protein
VLVATSDVFAPPVTQTITKTATQQTMPQAVMPATPLPRVTPVTSLSKPL